MQDMISRAWTQTELARRARVTDSAVSRLLNGKSTSLHQISRVAKALGHPIERYVSVDPITGEDLAKSEESSCVRS